MPTDSPVSCFPSRSRTSTRSILSSADPSRIACVVSPPPN
jgi:hypothetical protein